MASPTRPARTSPARAGKEILVQGADYAQPWSFIPGFSTINDAFNNAMTAARSKAARSAHDVAAATKSGHRGKLP